MLEAVHHLSVATLRALAASLRDGPLAVGLSRHAIAQVIGTRATAVHGDLDELLKQGMAPAHIALLLETIAQTRERAADPQLLFDLVLSGPEVPGVPTADTAATVQTLIEGAQTEILLGGYTVHNGKKLFKRLADRARLSVRGHGFAPELAAFPRCAEATCDRLGAPVIAAAGLARSLGVFLATALQGAASEPLPHGCITSGQTVPTR
jgi:hypothetical protein